MSTEQLALLTKQQLEQIGTYFGIQPIPKETLPVRDGIVDKETLVWWRGQLGPERVTAGEGTHWENIKNYPQAYQLKQPATKIIYTD